MNQFEKNFENLKKPFKEKFGKSWNEDSALFLQYVQAEYIHSISVMLDKGVNMIVQNQQEVDRSIQFISKKLDKL